MTRTSEIRADLLILAGLVLLGALLRFSTLGTQSYWGDEYLTVLWTSQSIPDLLSSVSAGESTPPLYFLAAKAWAAIFGSGEVGLRSLSALAGTATIPVVYLAGRELISRRVAFVAAALAATSPLLLWYSQEARSYGLFVLFSSAAFLFYARALRRGSTRELIWWAVFCDLSLATHYFAIFFVIPEGAWLLYRQRQRPAPVAIACAQFAVVALALSPLAITQKHGGNGTWIPIVPKHVRVEQLPEQFAVGLSSPAAWVAALVSLLIAAGIALALARTDARERAGAFVAGGTAAVMLGIPLAAMLLGSDFVVTRNLIAAWLPLALLVAAGLGARRAGLLGLAGAGALCVLSAGAFLASTNNTTLQRPTWRAIAGQLHQSAQGRVVLLPSGSATKIGVVTAYYMPRSHLMAKVASADEIDVVGRANPAHYARDSVSAYKPILLACWWGGACSVRSAPLPTSPPAPGFRLVARGRAGLFTVLRFRAQRPVALGQRALLAFAVANRLSPTLALQQDAARP